MMPVSPPPRTTGSKRAVKATAKIAVAQITEEDGRSNVHLAACALSLTTASIHIDEQLPNRQIQP
jgi:hypothetical protein